MHTFPRVLVTSNTLEKTPPWWETCHKRREPELLHRALGVQVGPVHAISTYKVGKCPERVGQTVELVSDEKVTEFDGEEIAKDNASKRKTEPAT